MKQQDIEPYSHVGLSLLTVGPVTGNANLQRSLHVKCGKIEIAGYFISCGAFTGGTAPAIYASIFAASVQYSSTTSMCNAAKSAGLLFADTTKTLTAAGNIFRRFKRGQMVNNMVADMTSTSTVHANTDDPNNRFGQVAIRITVTGTPTSVADMFAGVWYRVWSQEDGATYF